MVRRQTGGYQEIGGGGGDGGGAGGGGGGGGGVLWRLVVTGLSLLVVLGLLTLTVLSLTSGLTEDAVVEVRLTSGGGWGRLGRLVPPDTPDPKWDPEPSQSKLGRFDYAAVSVDSIPCSTIGK